MALNLFDQNAKDSIPLVLVIKKQCQELVEAQPERVRNWLQSWEFGSKSAAVVICPGLNGKPERAFVSLSDSADMNEFYAIAAKLPPLDFHIEHIPQQVDLSLFVLGWALSCYQFSRYKNTATETRSAQLAWPETVDKKNIERNVHAITLIRNLINTPAEDMGPAELADESQVMAKTHGAVCTVIRGDELLTRGYPAIHRVGRASHNPPCLIDFIWGNPSHPKVTLIGKGVCFDSGGLDIKSDTHMRLMKKDMGGAAHVLGIAYMIMDAQLPIRLRVLIPAVENSVSGNAMRPLDVIRTRKGITVEIGHTDAEGRVILADALAEADSEKPELMIDIATLTGAARVALGTDLPALFCNNDIVAETVLEEGKRVKDQLWRMPLWQPYRKLIESEVAELSNDSESRYGGAITAALFLESFVSSHTYWAHIDVMAWNASSCPGRPVGGEAMGARALFAAIERIFGRSRAN